MEEPAEASGNVSDVTANRYGFISLQ